MSVVKYYQGKGFGHLLLASGFLGGLSTPIISSQLGWDKSTYPIVSIITSCTQLLGSIVILYTAAAISRNKREWITRKCSSMVEKVRVVVLWILGIILCILRQMDGNIYQTCRNPSLQIYPKIDKGMSIVFVVLQTLFTTWCSLYEFYDSRKVRYILAVLAVTNMVNWLDANVTSVFLLAESNSTTFSENWNCTYVTYNQKTLSRLVDVFLLPNVMEFSILSTTLIISMPFRNKYGTIHCLDITRFRSRDEYEETRRQSSFSGKEKLSITAMAVILNAPFLVYIIIFPLSKELLLKIKIPWVQSIIAAKIVIFISILAAYYTLHKTMDMKQRSVHLDFNDQALILCSSAVSASGVVNFLYQGNNDPFTITFHTFFNIIYVLYQTIFTIFLNFVEFHGGNLRLLIKLKMIMIILISYNLMYWVKDSMFFISFIDIDIQSDFFRILFFLLYPLQSFYRFQSAMGMILFYSKLRFPPRNQSTPF
jgi:hypothetical protein